MKMKRISSILSLIVMGTLFFSSCSKTEKKRIRLDETATVSIPAHSGDSIFIVESSDVPNSLKTKLSEAGMEMENIKDITLGAMEMIVTNPTNSSFSFCTAINVYLTGGSNDILIATINRPNLDYLNMNPIFLTRPVTDLIEYFKNDNLKYKVVFTMRRDNNEAYEVQLKPIYFIETEKSK
ncbi:MAG: hypothetical protein J5I91_00625 [Bacteroidetes bacterium]|nr:hypothetical protein [Bacteroidota bacterium]